MGEISRTQRGYPISHGGCEYDGPMRYCFRRTDPPREPAGAIGAVVARFVHTEEVTGSNPVSPTPGTSCDLRRHRVDGRGPSAAGPLRARRGRCPVRPRAGAGTVVPAT